MSLVYTTLLSIVPLIAFSFSILKGFGYHREFEPVLESFLAPLGPRGEELTQQIIGFVDNVRGDVLGSVGLLLLIYTVISMVQKVEDAFNYIWRVDRARSFARRFSDYLSVIVIGPVVMVLSFGLIASVTNTTVVQRLSQIEPFGTALVLIGKITPFIVVSLVFTFLYAFVPNTRVKLKSALIGGLTAGVLWAATSKIFTEVVAYSGTRFAIYGFFAIALLTFIWLYLNWLILLLGAQISFYHQHPEFLRTGRKLFVPDNSLRERLALTIMYLVGRDYLGRTKRWTTNALASYLEVPGDSLGSIVDKLEGDGLLVTTESQELLPGRDMGNIALRDIVSSIRTSPYDREIRHSPGNEKVDMVADAIDTAISESLAGRTLEDLVND